MSDEFDPYVEWLGITPAAGPADHYALLGLKRFESNEAKIVAAADARMELLRKYQNGARSKLSQQILNEVSSARVCLLDQERRDYYNNQLRKRIDINALPDMKSPTKLFPDQPVAEKTVPAAKETSGTGTADVSACRKGETCFQHAQNSHLGVLCDRGNPIGDRDGLRTLSEHHTHWRVSIRRQSVDNSQHPGVSLCRKRNRSLAFDQFTATGLGAERLAVPIASG